MQSVDFDCDNSQYIVVDSSNYIVNTNSNEIINFHPARTNNNFYLEINGELFFQNYYNGKSVITHWDGERFNKIQEDTKQGADYAGRATRSYDGNNFIVEEYDDATNMMKTFVYNADTKEKTLLYADEFLVSNEVYGFARGYSCFSPNGKKLVVYDRAKNKGTISCLDIDDLSCVNYERIYNQSYDKYGEIKYDYLSPVFCNNNGEILAGIYSDGEVLFFVSSPSGNFSKILELESKYRIKKFGLPNQDHKYCFQVRLVPLFMNLAMRMHMNCHCMK